MKNRITNFVDDWGLTVGGIVVIGAFFGKYAALAFVAGVLTRRYFDRA